MAGSSVGTKKRELSNAHKLFRDAPQFRWPSLTVIHPLYLSYCLSPHLPGPAFQSSEHNSGNPSLAENPVQPTTTTSTHHCLHIVEIECHLLHIVSKSYDPYTQCLRNACEHVRAANSGRIMHYLALDSQGNL